MPPGEGSGVLAIVPGTHPFTIENAGAKPRQVSGSVTVKHGGTVAVICYDEVAETRDGREEARLRYNLLVEGESEPGARLSLVSLLPDPFVGLEISGIPATLPRRQAHRTPLTVGEAVTITRQGRTLAEFEVLKPVHHLGFLFDNPETGEAGLSLILNEKLEYQPPLEPDEGKAGAEEGGGAGGKPAE